MTLLCAVVHILIIISTNRSTPVRATWMQKMERALNELSYSGTISRTANTSLLTGIQWGYLFLMVN